MSELNIYHNELRPDEYDEFYLKSEADKVIARHKYKRCLAMADMCQEALCYWDNAKYTYFKGEAYCFRKLNHYGRWGQIWLSIAEKFKQGLVIGVDEATGTDKTVVINYKEAK